jgi:hypothetical protein
MPLGPLLRSLRAHYFFTCAHLARQMSLSARAARVDRVERRRSLYYAMAYWRAAGFPMLCLQPIATDYVIRREKDSGPLAHKLIRCYDNVTLIACFDHSLPQVGVFL